MLISPATAAGMADGSVTLAFRRWDRPRMRPGSTQRTSAGVVEVVTLDEVDPAALTDDDAARAGVGSPAELRRLLERRSGVHVYRMQVRAAGPDPRVALRESRPTCPRRTGAPSTCGWTGGTWPGPTARGPARCFG